MSQKNQSFDEVGQLRNLGIGFIIGGGILGGGSFILPLSWVAGGLTILGLGTWVVEWNQGRTVGIGLGIAMVGVILAIDITGEIGIGAFEIAAFAIVAGVIDYLLAPWYATVRESGE